MPVYSVNRRRAIILLILSSVLLLTLDLRGSPLIDRSRSAFAKAAEPFETAADVVATPIKNTWHAINDYDRIARENEELRDEIAQQRGDQLYARAIVNDWLELAALVGLVVNYPRVTARVVGGAPGNFEQTVEIDRGSEDGILVGAPVVSPSGLVGKITKVYTDRSVVRLITDAEYAIECKVSAVPEELEEATGDATGTGSDDDDTETTEGTTPSGFDRDDLTTTTTAAPTTTTTTLPPGQTSTTAAGTTTTVAGGATSTTVPGESTTSTTTTVLVPQEREVGGCEGRGAGKLPAMRFVTENPAFGHFGVGDIITTAGGSKSLAPPGLIIGEVINVVHRLNSAGPLLEIDIAADLDHLNFVQVLKYRPPPEVPDS